MLSAMFTFLLDPPPPPPHPLLLSSRFTCVHTHAYPEDAPLPHTHACHMGVHTHRCNPSPHTHTYMHATHTQTSTSPLTHIPPPLTHTHMHISWTTPKCHFCIIFIPSELNHLFSTNPLSHTVWCRLHKTPHKLHQCHKSNSIQLYSA